MNRWSICDMVEGHILGFLREKDNEKYEPHEEVTTITRNIAEDTGLVLLKSKNYEATFKEEFFQPAQRLFKGATLYLASRPKSNDTGLGHLLIFALGSGFHAVMVPVVSDEERKKFTREGKL